LRERERERETLVLVSLEQKKCNMGATGESWFLFGRSAVEELQIKIGVEWIHPYRHQLVVEI
jgi:hypothetical protein